MERNAAKEMERADFGDIRLTRRGVLVTEALAARPGLSLPEAMQTDAALEAFYRLVRNPKVSVDALLASHLEGTAAALGQLPNTAVVAHDTTEFAFRGRTRRKDLGDLVGGRQGFLGHFALGLEVEGSECRPIGALSFNTVFREGRKGKQTPAQARKDPFCEGKRWWQTVQDCEQRLAPYGTSVVHVMDREADDYTLFQDLVCAGFRFVIRANHDRFVVGPKGPIRASELPPAETTVIREVSICHRENFGDKARHHASRDARTTRLKITGHRVDLLRPEHLLRDIASTMECHLVVVEEVDCPEGEVPVSWRLWTTESIFTEAELQRVVDLYRARWCIEEFFKALKTGCSYERRQLESRFTLLNALGLYIPVACQILRLKVLGRGPERDLPARLIFSDSALQALGAATKRDLSSEVTTVRDAMMAVARLGGHIKNNGDPGWQVLWRGYQAFLVFQAGWEARGG